MNKYELGVVVRADLEEENFQAEMTRVKGLIERFDGTIDKVDEWGRRKLAYPIKKLTEGMYTFITFTSPSSAPREIEDRLRIMENVLRFLIVSKDENDVSAPAPAPKEPISPKAEEPEIETMETEAVETDDVETEAVEAEVVEAEVPEVDEVEILEETPEEPVAESDEE